MPRKPPQISRYRHARGIETCAKEPHHVLTGLGIQHVRAVVGLPKGALEPRAGCKTKISIEKSHYRDNRSTARQRVDAVRLKPRMQVLAQPVWIDQEGQNYNQNYNKMIWSVVSAARPVRAGLASICGVNRRSSGRMAGG